MVEKLTLKHGISLDEHLHNDFETIVHELTEEVRNTHTEKTHLDVYFGSSNYRPYS